MTLVGRQGDRDQAAARLRRQRHADVGRRPQDVARHDAVAAPAAAGRQRCGRRGDHSRNSADDGGVAAEDGGSAPSGSKQAVEEAGKRLAALRPQLGVGQTGGGGGGFGGGPNPNVRARIGQLKAQIMGSTSPPTAMQIRSATEAREDLTKVAQEVNDLIGAVPQLRKTRRERIEAGARSRPSYSVGEIRQVEQSSPSEADDRSASDAESAVRLFARVIATHAFSERFRRSLLSASRLFTTGPSPRVARAQPLPC